MGHKNNTVELIESLKAAAFSLLLFILVFIPMEFVFPAKAGQKLFRPAWFTDFLFFAGQYLLWSILVLGSLSYFSIWLQDFIPRSFSLLVSGQPWWLQAAEVVLLSDFLIYWGHRLQHNVDFLWRFHKVHHTAEHMDWLAAHREHPLDSLFTIGLINLPAFILGFPLDAIAGLIAFRGIWAVYIHSNVRLPIGPLRILIGAPELHHWHHDRDQHAGNYANLSPLMDIAFGTYTCPDREPENFGIVEPFPKNYAAQLLHPMLPDFLARRLFPVIHHHPTPAAMPEVEAEVSATAV